MSFINYFKLDFRLMRGTLKYFAVMPLLFLFMSLKESPIMGMGYIFFFLIIVAATPFSIESNEKCDRMYYMFPAKISSMVLGRFLYLLTVLSIVWIVDGSAMMYLYKINRISIAEVGVMFLTGMIATISCALQYPIYYKFGMEKGRIISMMLYMIPAFIVFALPSSLKKSSVITSEAVQNIINFTMVNKTILILLSIVIFCIIVMISYIISCSICRKKEI